MENAGKLASPPAWCLAPYWHPSLHHHRRGSPSVASSTPSTQKVPALGCPMKLEELLVGMNVDARLPLIVCSAHPP